VIALVSGSEQFLLAAREQSLLGNFGREQTLRIEVGGGGPLA